MRLDRAAHDDYAHDVKRSEKMDPRAWIAQFIPEPGYNPEPEKLPHQMPRLRLVEPVPVEAAEQLPEAA